MLDILLIATCAVLALDALWLTIMKAYYAKLVKGVQHSSLTIKMWPAVFSYICVVIGVVFFAYPMAQAARMSKPLAALVYGGGLGFVIYGVWNFTNLAVFKDYDVLVGLLDLCWGVVLYSFVVYLLLWYKARR